jgi:hypothetical protein
MVSPAVRAQPTEDPEFAALQAKAQLSFKEEVAPFIETYCSKCHGQRRQRGGINFLPATRNPGAPSSVIRWKQAVASVKTHDMPPEDTDPLPSDEERAKFLNGITQIKYLSAKDPGEFVIRRLNRREYGNTLRDLFGVDPRLADDLPDEVFGEGYLNSLSPLQMEQFLDIANVVLDQVLAPEGKTPTALQRKLLGKTPSSKAGYPSAAREVARSLARQCYRRPPSEAELDTLMDVFDLAQRNKLSYPASLRLMLKAVLVSPQFLFITPSPEAERGGAIVPLDDHQLASRLSYFLWSTMPDAELSRLADGGKLRDPAVLRAQVKRMLADKRSLALFDGFGAQWLGVGGLAEKTFDPEKFPQMTPALRAAMQEEARLFFDSVLRGNRSVVTFVDADYTFLNRTLAPLYGLEKKVTGSSMRRVQLANANRGGILGMPGVLAVTSFPNRTSPVKRGVWDSNRCSVNTSPRRRRTCPSWTSRTRSPSPISPSASAPSCTARTPPAPTATASSTPSGSDWKTSTPSGAGATGTTRAGPLTPRANCRAGRASPRPAS